MKLDLRYPLVFLLGAAICYWYFFLATNFAVAKLQGQVDVFSQFCKPQLEQANIIKKEQVK